MGISGRDHGRGSTVPVAVVAAADHGEHALISDRLAAGEQFGVAPTGADFSVGDHEDLHVGVRHHDGADIAAIEYGAGFLAGKIALEL